ncbi:hypothetical protein BX666DRAFT_638752 [Dichotomocladium elegans]|nr:hypothetical protein BX666DRAFT_638752 [Dichotomocladium elegans]
MYENRRKKKDHTSDMPSSILYQQGWLLKQRHGIYKSWDRRYFVLDGNELRYYKSEISMFTKAPQHTLCLDDYQLAITNKKPYTILLIANNGKKKNMPDFFLRASSHQEVNLWVDALQSYARPSTDSEESVLDKWLDRIDAIARPTSTGEFAV